MYILLILIWEIIENMLHNNLNYIIAILNSKITAVI